MTVVKADGRLVPFEAESLYASIDEATDGWHSPEQIRQVIRGVTVDLFATARPEPVPTVRIGERVSMHLKRLNPVSHIRFALAFEGGHNRGTERAGFEDARGFRRWLGEEYPHLDRAILAARLSSVAKVRTASRERFDRSKLKRSAEIACKGCGTPEFVDRLSSDVANDVISALGEQPIVTTGQITAEMLRSLRRRNDLAYLRYASTVKRFTSELDYEAEALALENERRSVATRARAHDSAKQNPGR